MDAQSWAYKWAARINRIDRRLGNTNPLCIARMMRLFAMCKSQYKRETGAEAPHELPNLVVMAMCQQGDQRQAYLCGETA